MRDMTGKVRAMESEELRLCFWWDGEKGCLKRYPASCRFVERCKAGEMAELHKKTFDEMNRRIEAFNRFVKEVEAGLMREE